MRRYENGARRTGLPLAVIVAVVAVCAALAFMARSASAGGTPTVSANAAQAGLGGQATASLVVSNIPAAGVGAWTVDVSYDSSVVSLVDCRGLIGGVCNQTFGPQMMRVIGSTAAGVFSTSELATMTFRCNALGTAALGVSVDLLSDASFGDPQEYAATPISGSVTCVEAIPTDTPRPTNTPLPAGPTDTPVPGQPTDTPAPGRPTDTPVPGVLGDTPAPGSTPTETPETTPTGAATASPTLTSEVLAAVETPGPSDDEPASSVVQPPAAEGAAKVRPETTSAVMRFGDVSTDADVIATNIVLAIVLLCIMLGASALFNDTIDQNREELERRFNWLMTPLHMVGAAIDWVAGAIHMPERMQRILAPIGILLLCGLIYSFNEPVGFDSSGLLLFLTLIISIGVLTYTFEGGIALISRERYQVPSGVKVFPLAIVIALAFVIVSRIVNFEAPIMFGFVAVATALVATRLRGNDEAITAAIPATALLVLALVAWALLGPLRDAAGDNEGWLASLPSESAAMIFAGGIEGVLFAMIPVQFSDGYPIWRSLRWWWVLLAGVSAFVFSWALLNPAAAEVDALIAGRVLTAIGLTAAYATGVLLVWGYFTLKARRESPGPANA